MPAGSWEPTTSLNRYAPTLVPGATNIKAVAAGDYHTLVLTADGNVLATGDNAYGQLGDGTTTSRDQLQPVKNASLIGSIAARLAFTACCSSPSPSRWRPV